MAKVILGKPPKAISKELTFPMLDGTTGSIKVTYKYRTRTEFGTFVDSMIDVIKQESEAAIAAAREKAKDKADDAVQSIDLGVSETEINAKKAQRQADFIMGCVEEWNLDIPFDLEAVEQLVDELPLAATTIIAAYREAMTEGRLGN
ncbi:phage tail assembly chaperone [Pseudoduganella sp. RAF19]|uniref:phage tail assembly chaperone n=2 Tax=cellular organisms TaxID=131567 RepID=UPI003F9533FF